MVNPISSLILFPFLKNIFNFRFTLDAPIQTDDNYIFVMNHASGLDLLLAAAVIVPMTGRYLSTFVDFEVHDNAFVWPLFQRWKSVRVDRRKPEGKKQAVDMGIKYLSKGHNILIFPEGEIYGGKTNEMCRASTGAVQLALRTGKSIIPIGIKGSFKAWEFPYPCNYPYNLKNLLNFDFSHPIQMNFGSVRNLSNNHDVNLDEINDVNRSLLRNLTTRLMLDVSNLAGYPYLHDLDSLKMTPV